MRNLKTIYILLTLGLMSFVYASANDVPKSQLEGKWVLKTINNRNVGELFSNRAPYLIFNFDIEQVSGNSGCNSFSGKFNYGGGKFEAPNIASGDMACPGSNDEATFIGLLNKSSKLSILNGDLIFSQDNMPVLIFSRAQPLTNNDLMGVWRLQSIDGKDVKSDFASQIPSLEFNFMSNRLSGNAGCNNYNADFTLRNNVLEVKPLVSTRTACEKMDGEAKFIKTFTDRMDIDIEKGVLILRKDNKEIMTFKR